MEKELTPQQDIEQVLAQIVPRTIYPFSKIRAMVKEPINLPSVMEEIRNGIKDGRFTTQYRDKTNNRMFETIGKLRQTYPQSPSHLSFDVCIERSAKCQ